MRAVSPLLSPVHWLQRFTVHGQCVWTKRYKHLSQTRLTSQQRWDNILKNMSQVIHLSFINHKKNTCIGGLVELPTASAKYVVLIALLCPSSGVVFESSIHSQLRMAWPKLTSGKPETKSRYYPAKMRAAVSWCLSPSSALGETERVARGGCWRPRIWTKDTGRPCGSVCSE